MKFSEWWDTSGKLSEDSLRYRELKAWASLAFEAGVTEGSKQAQVERSDTTQGGGSQTPAPVASNVKACALNAIERGIELLDAVAHGKTTTKWVIKSAVRKLEFAALALKGEAKLNNAAPAPAAPPVAWTDLLREAELIVKRKPLWKRFIDGTPLENDIAVWMADFAQEHAAPAPVACRYPECGCRADLGEAWKACSTKGA